MRVSWRLLASICLAVGCARGTATIDDADAGTSEDFMPLGGKDASDELDPPGDGANEPGGSSGRGNSGSDGEPDAPSDPDASVEDPDGAMALASCPAPVTCDAAAALGIANVGSIEWAETAPIASKRESGNRFYVVSVTGDSASEVVKGGIEARLTSPAGSNYDVYLYGGAKGYNSELDTCEEPKAASDSGAGGVDSVSRVWAAAAFGVLSDRAVTVEVRHVSGPCAAFNLELLGRKE